ncbi:hypothetical protein CMV30_03525 [Nibricoccus aquaticus]|uniref:Uncharacterized protein n=1 Tax=Nibricoccus aquaticus TaxID=2576891 RepID=A0A290Q7E7_9BACT|nr:hypothetical protein CMV30_03525 [Nibricoccus aquaticus]
MHDEKKCSDRKIHAVFRLRETRGGAGAKVFSPRTSTLTRALGQKHASRHARHHTRCCASASSTGRCSVSDGSTQSAPIARVRAISACPTSRAHTAAISASAAACDERGAWISQMIGSDSTRALMPAPRPENQSPGSRKPHRLPAAIGPPRQLRILQQIPSCSPPRPTQLAAMIH